MAVEVKGIDYEEQLGRICITTGYSGLQSKDWTWHDYGIMST